MQHPCHDPSKDVAMRSAMRLMNDDIDIIRLNLVKIRFSQNAFFIFLFTGGAFIVVKYNIKLVLKF